jgi:hypothetical protein
LVEKGKPEFLDTEWKCHNWIFWNEQLRFSNNTRWIGITESNNSYIRRKDWNTKRSYKRVNSIEPEIISISMLSVFIVLHISIDQTSYTYFSQTHVSTLSHDQNENPKTQGVYYNSANIN